MRSFFLLTVFACLTVNLLAAPAKKLPSAIKEIYLDELSKLIKEKKKIILIDARSARFDDRLRLPGALSIPYNTPQKTILEKMPTKEVTIIVYCGHQNCPSSHYMAERLIRMGYTTIYKYSDGVKGWVSSGNPTEAAKEPQVPDVFGELL